jgi:hypothetical protein
MGAADAATLIKILAVLNLVFAGLVRHLRV